MKPFVRACPLVTLVIPEPGIFEPCLSLGGSASSTLPATLKKSFRKQILTFRKYISLRKNHLLLIFAQRHSIHNNN
jgi:hypothetical protein